MKKLFLLIAFTFCAFFTLNAQQSGTYCSDEKGYEYQIVTEWTLVQNQDSILVEGRAQGVGNTPSYYWQLIRTRYADSYGYFTYFLYFYSNAAYWDPYLKDWVPHDLILRHLVVLADNRIVYENAFFYVDSKGTATVSFFTSDCNSRIHFEHEAAIPKRERQEQKLRKYGNGN